MVGVTLETGTTSKKCNTDKSGKKPWRQLRHSSEAKATPQIKPHSLFEIEHTLPTASPTHTANSQNQRTE
jgi:hypothetical protein